MVHLELLFNAGFTYVFSDLFSFLSIEVFGLFCYYFAFQTSFCIAQLVICFYVIEILSLGFLNILFTAVILLIVHHEWQWMEI